MDVNRHRQTGDDNPDWEDDIEDIKEDITHYKKIIKRYMKTFNLCVGEFLSAFEELKMSQTNLRSLFEKFDKSVESLNSIEQSDFRQNLELMWERNLNIKKEETLNCIYDKLEGTQAETLRSLYENIVSGNLEEFCLRENVNFSNYLKCLAELAVCHGNGEVLSFLVKNNININYQDENKNTVLHHAFKWFIRDQLKYQNIVKVILKEGAKLDVENDEGKTPFDLLINCVEDRLFDKEKRLSCISELLSSCTVEDPLKDLDDTLLNKLAKFAIEHNDEEVLSFLVENNINVNYQDEERNKILHHTFEWFFQDEWKYRSIAKLLLSKGAKLDVENDEGKTPFDLLINYVMRGGSSRKLKKLSYTLELLSNCTDKGILKGLNGTRALNRLVNTVVNCNHKEALDFLIENNIQISSTIDNIVTRDCNKKVLGCFLHKSKVNYRDESGDTTLHHALRHLHCYDSRLCKVVELLASEGARFDIENKKGETPFDLLVEYVEEGFYGQARRLSDAWNLLNKCENKDVLRELKYKDGTPALNKLKELHIKCRNTSIIVASTLAVAGVALGIAIAVYSEMLAVGIAVGACCLVAAAAIYYCNSLSKLLEKSNAEAATNKCCLEPPN